MLGIFGDSLTAGTLGVSYVKRLKILADSGKASSLYVRGINGDTMTGVLHRARTFLLGRHAGSIQGLILESGSNDLLLPFMSRVSTEWNQAVKTMIKPGREPIPKPEAFIERLAGGLTEILNIASALNLSPADIAVMTVPLLGEDLDSYLNTKKRVVNEEIRNLCRSLELICIDPEPELEDAVRRMPCPSFFPSAEVPGLFARDAAYTAGDDEKADELSRIRELAVTIDGLHPNTKGADIIARAVLKEMAGKDGQQGWQLRRFEI
jgi:lysophospholipase L1-like esterase